MTVQNHIHLAASSGTAGPPVTYSVSKRRRTPEIHLTVKMMANGTLRVQRLDSGGVPLVGREYEYELFATQAEVTALEALYGKKIYLVDNIHCADGADHTTYVEDVYFVEDSASENLDPLLEKNRVKITLRVNQ